MRFQKFVYHVYLVMFEPEGHPSVVLSLLVEPGGLIHVVLPDKHFKFS